MNDREAIDAINEAFDAYCDEGASQLLTLSRIAQVLGRNKIAQAIAKAKEIQ